MKKLLLLSLCTCLLMTCKNEPKEEKELIVENEVNETMEKETNGEWTILFDGTSFDSWRGYLSDEMHPEWTIEDGTMAAILGLDDNVVEEACEAISDIVVPANYNCPGQLVVSGSIEGINAAVEVLKEKGARRALVLPVGGAFHSPLMAPAEERLAKAINETEFSNPICPVYQNVDATPHTDPADIKSNLIKQLTGAVRWTQTIQNMANDGITDFAECGGSGKVLMGLIRKINRELNVESV